MSVNLLFLSFIFLTAFFVVLLDLLLTLWLSGVSIPFLCFLTLIDLPEYLDVELADLST